jgi:transcriptional regulator with XRE-family HTH domain
MKQGGNQMTVADRIKERRIELNMTQKELSDKIGTKDRSSISKIESRGDDISMKDIIRIADALGVTPKYLLGWENVTTTDSFGEMLHKASALVRSSTDGKAIEFAELYLQASPEVQSAVLTLLKSAKPDPDNPGQPK